jgi:Ca2+-binding EF-hand superfamily protein
MIFSHYDQSGDGTIDYKEFSKWVDDQEGTKAS